MFVILACASEGSLNESCRLIMLSCPLMLSSTELTAEASTVPSISPGQGAKLKVDLGVMLMMWTSYLELEVSR